jgi:hypothetical protein
MSMVAKDLYTSETITGASNPEGTYIRVCP